MPVYVRPRRWADLLADVTGPERRTDRSRHRRPDTPGRRVRRPMTEDATRDSRRAGGAGSARRPPMPPSLPRGRRGPGRSPTSRDRDPQVDHGDARRAGGNERKEPPRSASYPPAFERNWGILERRSTEVVGGTVGAGRLA